MSETPPTEEPPKRRAPLDIWREVRRVVCTLFDLFGDPGQIAARHTLTLKDHQRHTNWLRAVEALMRRMLLIEAALINSELPTPPPARGRLGGGPALRVRPDPLLIAAQSSSPLQGEECQRFDAEHPEAWRVSFRCFSSPVHGGSGSRAARDEGGDAAQSSVSEAHCPLSHAAHDSSPACGGAKSVGAMRFRSAWPLAARTEALLRVFNDPMPFAKRLAARLRKCKTLIAPLCAPWREYRDVVTRTLFDALIKPVECARTVFDTT